MPETPAPERVMVNVTLFQEPIVVPEDEVEVLRSQGLLRPTPEDEPAAPVAIAKSTPATRKDSPTS